MKHNFKELKIWKKSRELVKEVYVTTDEFPDKEKFGLTSQIRRSAVSIPSNIAEGSARATSKDFSRFLKIALGSCYELETQLYISQDLGFISDGKIERLFSELDQVERMIIGFDNGISK